MNDKTKKTKEIISIPWLGKDFFKQDTETLTVKKNIDKLNFTKIKTFCSLRHHDKSKSKPQAERIFVMHLSNEGLLSSMYKELCKSIIRR